MRAKLWNMVINTFPGVLGIEMNSREMAVKTKFILNAFNSTYVEEWHNLYTEICNVYNY